VRGTGLDDGPGLGVGEGLGVVEGLVSQAPRTSTPAIVVTRPGPGLGAWLDDAGALGLADEAVGDVLGVTEGLEVGDGVATCRPGLMHVGDGDAVLVQGGPMAGR
jgi:hypothetical protein